MPHDVGIVGGVTPAAAPPPGWTGSWDDPTSNTGSSDQHSHSQSASASASQSQSQEPSSCPKPTGVYDLPDDPEDSDWDALGTDPDRRSLPVDSEGYLNLNLTSRDIILDLERRDKRRRHFFFSLEQGVVLIVFTDIEISCPKGTNNLVYENTRAVKLRAGIYYTLGDWVDGGTSLQLDRSSEQDRPDTLDETNRQYFGRSSSSFL
jgi:hypothetical protein